MRKPLISADCQKKLQDALKYELGHFYLYKHLAICMQAVGFYGDMLALLENEKDNKNVCMIVDEKLKQLAK